MGNQFPIDKFTAENIIRTHNYKESFQQLNPVNTKFCDEAHVRESDAFSKYARVDPLTGLLEPIKVHSNFCLAFTIIGLCGIDPTTIAFDYYIHRGRNTSEYFVDAIKQSIRKGFLKEYDTLILDNASIHRFGAARKFCDWLCTNHHIFLLFLPTRSPELNPIEMIWNIHLQRLRMYRREVEGFENNVLDILDHILDHITHDDVKKCYKKCISTNF